MAAPLTSVFPINSTGPLPFTASLRFRARLSSINTVPPIIASPANPPSTPPKIALVFVVPFSFTAAPEVADEELLSDDDVDDDEEDEEDDGDDFRDVRSVDAEVSVLDVDFVVDDVDEDAFDAELAVSIIPLLGIFGLSGLKMGGSVCSENLNTHFGLLASLSVGTSTVHL